MFIVTKISKKNTLISSQMFRGVWEIEMFMIFHAIMADIKTDEFVLAPEISDISDGNREKKFITFR